MKTRLLRWLQRGTAVLLGLTIGLLIAEGLMRSQGYVPKQLNALRGFHQSHPTLGWLGEPDYHAIFERNGFRVEVEHDPAGFRKAQHGLGDLPAEARRIAVLGDSFTWGWGVPQGAVFTDEMQRALGRDVHVRNFGVNAFGTGQQSLLLEHFVADWRPDQVVLMVYGNDLHDNVDAKRGKRPYFTIENERLTAKNQPVQRKIAGPSRSLSRHSVAISHAHYFVGTRLANWKKARRARAAERAQASPAGSEASPTNSTPPPAPTLEEVGAFTPENAAVFRALLGRIKAQCQALPGRPELRVVYIPSPWETCAGQANAIGAWVADCALELGLPFRDLTPELHGAWSAQGERGNAGQPIYLSRDEHWDQLGHELVGRSLAAWLQTP